MATIDAHGALHDSQGLYANQNRPAPGYDLGDPPATPPTGTVPVTVPGKFTVYELPSPRHRKPQPVTYEYSPTVQVRQVSADQAPVAFDMGERFRWGDPTKGEPRRVPLGRFQVREFDGVRYQQAGWTGDQGRDRWHDIKPQGAEDLARSLRPYDWRGFLDEENLTWEQAEAQIDADLQTRADDALLIDGQLWRRCGEPRYSVRTWTGGFGGQHGSASVEVSVDMDDSGIPVDHIFRADQYDDALALARQEHARLAARWNDVSFDEGQSIVCDPASLRLVLPARETDEVKTARQEYAELVGSHQSREFAKKFERLAYHPADAEVSNAEEEAWFSNLVAARQRVLDLTDDVSGERANTRPYERED